MTALNTSMKHWKIFEAYCTVHHKTTELSTSQWSALADHTKEKNMVVLLLIEKSSLNLNHLKPSPTLKLMMIISEH